MGQPHPQAACSGKSQYLTWGKAAHAAKWLHRRTGECVQPYHCLYCSRFHVGSVARRGVV